MKKSSVTFVAATIMAGGISVGGAFGGASPAPASSSSSNMTGSSSHARAVQLAEKRDPTADTHEMQRVTAEAADRALGAKAIPHMLELVAAGDRARIEKDLSSGDERAYQEVADKIRQEWKTRYGEEFAAQGHVQDMKDLSVDFAGGAGAHETARVHLPAEPGEPAYELRLVREKSGYWRFELPDTVDGKTFAADMKKSVDRVAGEMKKLPKSKDQAYERVTADLLHPLAFSESTKAKK